jgi:heavy metal sensor kinase
VFIFSKSIKLKTISANVLVLFVLLLFLGFSLYFDLKRIIIESVDEALLAKAKALATLIMEDEGTGFDFNFSDEVMSEYSTTPSGNFFVIRKANGVVIEQSSSAKDWAPPYHPTASNVSYETIKKDGGYVRIVNFKVQLNRDEIIIQCGQKINTKLQILEKHATFLSVSILAIMIMSSLGIFFAVNRSFYPLKEISETVAKISEKHLSERINSEKVPTELKQLAHVFNRTFDSLEVAFEKQRQFIADASHELKTPLTVILTDAEVALRKDRSPEEYRKTLSNIANAAEISRKIINALFTLSRLDMQSIEFKRELINVKDVVNSSLLLLNSFIQDKRIRVTKAIPDNLLIRGDQVLLTELMSNILDNAIKYNKEGGKIHIEGCECEGHVLIQVKDSGIGIPEKDLPRVFDRFYRVDKSRSRKTGGSGLGLSICQEIVKLHDGLIKIESKVGEGTTVHLRFLRA